MAPVALEFYVSIFLLWIIVSIVYCQQINNMLEYNLLEEDPGGTIANIPIDSRITQLYSSSELQTITYHFLSQTAPHQESFEIGETSGILRSVQPVDRDAICRHISPCDIQFDIVTEPRDHFHIIKVTIHIIDLNDNSPNFEEDTISISMLETTISGTSFALPSAYDADIGEFGIQSFALEPQLVNFALDANINPDGSLNLHLILANRVDRETNEYYNLRVVAWDGGTPVRSGTLDIDITVIDSNDNNPKFLNTTYQVSVDENLPIGRSIFQVRAYDPDDGPNGELAYEFTRSTLNAYGDLFGINRETGYIYTKEELDHERGDFYILSVMAKDGGINPLSSYTKVNILVNDLNDNAPEITVNALHGLHAEIPENAGVGAFVAHVVIRDEDSGENGQFTCSMTSDYFTLEYLYGNEYQILTTAVFDREEQDQYSVELRCVDKGNTPQVTSKIIPVYITDMNDHNPVFNSDTFAISIDEGNNLQAYIGTITATDVDIGQNAAITYTIVQDSPVPRPGMEALSMDPRAGILNANTVFDYEDHREFRFTIIATDGGSRPLSNTAVLVLTISDVNDEPPIFTNVNYVFGTYENQAVDTEIGTLRATDRDATPGFRNISFDLDPRLTDIATFGIDNQTGKLFSKKVLDRELKSQYNVVAVAYNDGYNLMTSANITIHVADRNDNAPTFEFPRPNNNTVEIRGNHKVAERITQILASDLDIGDNAALSYSIVYGDERDHFEINSFNGELSLKKRLDDNTFNQVIELVILVKDGGSPSLSATETLNVFINGTFAITKTPKQEGSKNNVAIIIICVLVFFIICIALALVALFFLRRRSLNQQRQRDEQKYGCRVEATKTLVDMNTSSNSIRTDFSDPTSNKSCSFRSGNTISYISAEDAQAANYQSIYLERLPTQGTTVDGYCPAGTLVPNDTSHFPPKADISFRELQIQVRAGDVDHEVDNSSLTDSGKGSSEGDATNRASPLEHIKLPQNHSFNHGSGENTYRLSSVQQNVPSSSSRTPFQTYLTEHPHTEPCRRSSSNRENNSENCHLDHQRKTVHFVKPFSVQHDGPIKCNNVRSNRNVNKIPERDSTKVRTYANSSSVGQNCYPDNSASNVPCHVLPSGVHLAVPNQTAHNSLNSRGKDKANSKYSNRQVINLSQYLQERSRDSDGDSQADYSDGDTTTSGSYCMDDEDLAHDVLV